ncbi:hypothetical protein NDU88_000351 [Pleurodeles waltl]|uniref:Uncharacterized protein n=1 Tax=Pleurodeles waltl TaxID=8319 RepID=A0AAV7TEM6_PLEWA|nr:hypothetical protein NDU88_000351 [Pleurodeles waltl]
MSVMGPRVKTWVQDVPLWARAEERALIWEKACEVHHKPIASPWSEVEDEWESTAAELDDDDREGLRMMA